MTVKTKTTGSKMGNRKKSAILKATGATETGLNSFLQGLPPGILKKCSAQELAWIYAAITAKEQRKPSVIPTVFHRIRKPSWTIPTIKWKWIPNLKGWPVQALQSALLIVRGRK